MKISKPFHVRTAKNYVRAQYNPAPRHISCMALLLFSRRFPMQGSSIILVFAPMAILVMLMPAFEASTFPNIIKGSVIGLYFGISFIGILKMVEELRS